MYKVCAVHLTIYNYSNGSLRINQKCALIYFSLSHFRYVPIFITIALGFYITRHSLQFLRVFNLEGVGGGASLYSPYCPLYWEVVGVWHSPCITFSVCHSETLQHPFSNLQNIAGINDSLSNTKP